MKTDVVIIGGGLGGLAAAVELASNGVRVMLVEQAPRLGGRCYSYVDKKTGDIVDNGQHVLLGVYKHTLRYLETVGTRSSLRAQKSLSLPLYHPVKGLTELKIRLLPRPFHLTVGMLQFKALTLNERQQLLKVGFALRRWDHALERELASLTVDQWLTRLHQGAAALACIWHPLAISIMNEIPDRASALLFARSLKAAFLGKKSDSSMLIPMIGQSELYVNGAEEFLRRHGARIIVNSEVETIEIGERRARGVRLKDGTRYPAEFVISAVPYFGLRKIVPKDYRSIAPFDVGERFDSSPIVSIHCWFDADADELEFCGLIGRHVQWLFNRRRIMGDTKQRPAYLSAVISGAHDIVDLPKSEILRVVLDDVKRVLPGCNASTLVHSVIIKEKRATFSPTNEIESLRPSTETPVRNLFLAGDWTATGLPATIEGAVMSGVKAAQAVMD